MTITTFRIEVTPYGDKQHISDNKLVRSIHQFDIDSITGCLMARLFFIRGRLTYTDIQKISQELLANPVTETFTISEIDTPPSGLSQSDHCIEVTFLPGVTDPVAENLVRTAHLIGIDGLLEASTGQQFRIDGNPTAQELDQIAVKFFSNNVIQRFSIDEPISPPFIEYAEKDATVETIELLQASTEQLLSISQERRLSLNLEEMQAIQAYYQSEDREPTDIELEMLAQTWSEHCVHKTFKANITYHGPIAGSDSAQIVEQEIHGLLNTYLRQATDQLQKPWVRSAFIDNAGIIQFNDDFDVAFKVETHNHPSAIEPFGGSNTGVGGVIRDVLGVSARPIANTDVLCFGPQDLPPSELVEGMIHPQRIQAGVVHGVEDYGNKMGIPTVNGAILYHEGYTSNPLVFCGCLGLLPHGSHPTAPQVGDFIVVIGGRTGRDGLRGATFSSMEMDGTTGEVAGSSVQIGHPIHEKQVQEVILKARDEKLYSAITDCGAGGLSSAVGEMAEKIGAKIQLLEVPLKYPGLRPWEIWLSEAQERMVLAVPSENWPRMQEICNGQDIEAVCIGTFEGTGRLSLYYGEDLVGELGMQFLHDGIPTRHLTAVWTPPAINSETKTPQATFEESLLNLLAHPNIRSKEDVVRRYDHEVQGSTTVKPFVGQENDGPGDAAVLVPLDTQFNISTTSKVRGVALSNGINSSYGDLDPYAMAWAAVDEAMRNIVAVGADPEQVAILDNFCWGNPNLPDRLGSLVRCVQGCYDAAMAYEVPFVSGKDSLNNEYVDKDGQRHAIPGTLLISAVGIVPDVQRTVTMDFKQAGNNIYLVGDTRDELGGSHYHHVNNIGSGGQVPQPTSNALAIMKTLHQAIRQGTVVACHDCSEGGLTVALAEMCLAGRLGANLELHEAVQKAGVNDEIYLFSESLGRFLVEIPIEKTEDFEAVMAGFTIEWLGEVIARPVVCVKGEHNRVLLDEISLVTLENAWRGSISTPKDIVVSEPVTTVAKKFNRTINTRTEPPQVIILHANGSNRDRDAALAVQLAGGEAEIVHINQLLSGERDLLNYHMLIVPGGFSYGDDLGAGKLWATDLKHRLASPIQKFVADGRPVLGICNGFQVLVKSGLLPGGEFNGNDSHVVTLTHNELHQFECRWVYLKPNPHSPNLFTDGLDELIYCPVAHGEGRIVARDEATLGNLWQTGLAALTYVDAEGRVAGYPHNPNGSAYGIAGLTNAEGNVFGLMPHPEDHIFPWQHPRWHRGESGLTGLQLFKNGIKYA